MRGARDLRTERARRLRRDATNAELALWRRLRSRSLDGHKFVRQEPIGPYTVDFICREARLIIEVDGGQHADNRHDVLRDQWLTSHNYQVLRFWNNDVLGNVSGVSGNYCDRARGWSPSPASHLTMRGDLSPQAGRGEETYGVATILRSSLT
jgi:very-short-patch-repair endonuclease